MTDTCKNTSADTARYFIEQAHSFALRSRDPSVKTGAVIVAGGVVVLSYGWNQMPKGLNQEDPDRWERPAKYMFVEHAERCAIYSAARRGMKVNGRKMFATDPPCVDCARAIIQCGIKEFYYPQDHSFVDRMDEGQYSINQALNMLREANVYVEELSC